jgi:prepilin peptidase CpaA
MPHPLITSCALLFVAAVAIIDTRTHKIPNVLTVSAAVAALLLHGATSGLSGVLGGALGLLVGLAVFLPPFLVGGFGAGDVKAMAVVGAFLGWKGVLLAAVWTLVAGALFGIALLALRGGYPALRALMSRWALRLFALCAARITPNISPRKDDLAARRFPYGVAIASGTILSLAWS